MFSRWFIQRVPAVTASGGEGLETRILVSPDGAGHLP